jgi:hypothetical protein
LAAVMWRGLCLMQCHVHDLPHGANSLRPCWFL